MRDLIFVTCTSRRPRRIDFIRRHIRTLVSQIEAYHWIVVEDGDGLDPELRAVLEGWNSHYLHVGPTGDNGNAQRNLALEYVRDRRLDGIVYSLDDENLVYPALAAELRGISRVGIVPLGNLGPSRVERPIIDNGKLVRWDSGWAERKYPVAMGGFAFDSRLIFDLPSPIWDWRGLGGESEFIDRLVGAADELDFSPCHWNHICLAFHNEPLPEKPAASAAAASDAPTRGGESGGIQFYEDLPPAALYAPPGPRPRLALIGCGWFACEAHIPALLRLEQAGAVELVALCSQSEASLARAAALCGPRVLKQYREIDAALADPDIDLVDLVLPIGLMPQAIRAALHAGKHVISEKPCAPSVAQCLALASEHGGLARPPFWAVAENWRFKNATRLIDQIVKNGAIGRLEQADFQFITGMPASFLAGWRGTPDYAGANVLDSGVHFIALLRQVVGEVERVGASVSHRLAHLPPPDSVTATLDFANGAKGSFQLSFAATPQDARAPTLLLTGTNGSLHYDFGRNLLRLRQAGGEQVVSVADDPWVQGGVVATLAHCLAALRHDAPLRSSPSEGLRDVAIIEAMLDSGRSGKPATVPSLYPALHAGGRTVATFNGVWSFRPTHVVDCGSIAEICAAVTEAATAGLGVRAIGMANSWGPEVLTRGVSIALRRLNRIHGVDAAHRTVSLEAGVRLGDLTRVLAAHGLSLPSLPFNPHVTVGGAIASGTHGTSPKWGTLSDCVRSMRIVTASGEVADIGPASAPAERRAAAVAVGMLGVAVELELDAIPMPSVRLFELRGELSAFLAQRDAILAQYDHVWGHWTLGDDTILVECLEARPQPADGFVPYVTGDTGSWGSLRRSLPPAAALTVTRGGARQVWMSMQYGVALSEIETAIERIRASQFAAGHAGRIVEMKFLKGGDRSFLGFNAGRDSVLFNIWWTVDEDLKHTVFDEFEETMRSLDARPHWGKFHRLPEIAYLERAYPQWGEFEAVRSRFDPAGIFSIFSAHRPN